MTTHCVPVTDTALPQHLHLATIHQLTVLSYQQVTYGSRAF